MNHYLVITTPTLKLKVIALSLCLFSSASCVSLFAANIVACDTSITSSYKPTTAVAIDSISTTYGRKQPIVPGKYLTEKSSTGLSTTALSNASENEEDISRLLTTENNYQLSRSNRRALVHLARALQLKKSFRDRKLRSKLFLTLAKVSARLKLYPLAMKFYFKTIQLHSDDSLQNEQPIFTAETVLSNTNLQTTPSNKYASNIKDDDGKTEVPDTNFLSTPAYEELTNTDTVSELLLPARYTKESVPVNGNDICESFADGKTSIAYAMIVHVKQPAPGKRKAFIHINDVGHTYITLIKYNNDNSTVSRSFGFYPDKTNFFSATPIHPASTSVFKDDAPHDWDEAVGKFISFKRFEKIIQVIKKYNDRMYDLNQNNCTDFGLLLAAIGGIEIKDTGGTWPLGKGNNPANAGQSILEGKFANTDTDYKLPLFVCNNSGLSLK